jgi:hypothetical protein
MATVLEQFERSNSGTFAHHAPSPLTVPASTLPSLTPQLELNASLSPTLFRSSLLPQTTQVPGDSLRTALNLGPVDTTPVTVSDSVEQSNVNDYYRFTLNTASILDLSVVGAMSSVGATVIQDINNNRVVDVGETIGFASPQFGSSTAMLSVSLTAGTYFIQVAQSGMFPAPTGTNYNLSLAATPFEPPTDGAGNTLRTARNIGELTTPQTFTDFVASINSNIDPVDYYRFTLDTASTVDLSVIGANGTVGATLIQDSNGNRRVDPGEAIGSIGLQFGSSPGTLTTQLTAGTYFLSVAQGTMFGAPGGTDYSLTLTATPFELPPDLAGNTLRTARNIGELTTPQTFTDYIDGVNSNIDPNDYYRFTLDTASILNLSLLGASGSVSAALIQDVNRNRVVDAGEVIGSANPQFGSSTATLTALLEPGTYFIRLYQDGFFGATGGTDYTLDLATTPVSLAIEDISTSEMLEIL